MPTTTVPSSGKNWIFSFCFCYVYISFSKKKDYYERCGREECLVKSSMCFGKSGALIHSLIISKEGLIFLVLVHREGFPDPLIVERLIIKSKAMKVLGNHPQHLKDFLRPKPRGNAEGRGKFRGWSRDTIHDKDCAGSCCPSIGVRNSLRRFHISVSSLVICWQKRGKYVVLGKKSQTWCR